jgi:hypothetical protein
MAGTVAPRPPESVEWPDLVGPAMGARFELYVDRADEHRWRLVHDNGNVLADSGEGYASRQKCRQGIESVKRNAPGAEVVDVEE